MRTVVFTIQCNDDPPTTYHISTSVANEEFDMRMLFESHTRGRKLDELLRGARTLHVTVEEK